MALRIDREVLERKSRRESLLPWLPEAALDFHILPTRPHRLLPE
jgi:hypothetical protein